MALQSINLIEVSQSNGSSANQTSSLLPLEPMEGNVTAILKYISSSGTHTLGSVESDPITFVGERSNNTPLSNTPITFPNNIIEPGHQNHVDGMYYIEYVPEVTFVENLDSNPNELNIIETSDSFLEISQSLILPEDEVYRFTGSLQVYQKKASDPGTTGDLILSRTFTVPTSESIMSISSSWRGNTNYEVGDRFRFAVAQISKTPLSGLTVTSYTGALAPMYSRFSINPNVPDDLTNNNSGYNEALSINTTIPNYYGEGILPFVFATDCQPLLNNAVSNRLSSFLQDVDYTNVSGSQIPVNQQQLLDFTAVKASVPDSNYSSLKVVNPRYKGSKSTSSKLNVWTPKDIGTYGKLPTIELRNAIFGYFDRLIDPYPNINDKTQLNLTYLIDEQGNALPPNLGDDTISSLDSTFPEGKQARISLNEGSKELKELNNPYNTFIVGKYIAPIMYTQTSGHEYTTSLPLEGSGRISMYDNEDSGSFTNLAFTAFGTPSDAPNTPDSTLTSSFDLPYVEYNPYGSNPGNSFAIGTGEINFNGDGDAVSGENTSQDYTIFFETSFATNFIYESGRAEMNVKLSLENNGTNIPFNFEDIQLKLHKAGQVIDIGSVITDSNDIVRFETQGISQQKGLNSNNEVEMIFENYAINSFLISKNLYVNGQGGTDFKGDIDAFEWVIKANTEGYNTKKDDKLKWKLNGELNGGNERTNVFFPTQYPGEVLPTKITMVGSKNHLFESDNTGSAPFWVYTGSTGGNTDILDQSILVMSSSNINEAYGRGFFQSNLEYTPGPSEFFPNGQEPSNTRFDNIKYPIEFQTGDEIRFGNNENYTYTIKQVLPPQENVEGDNKGRTKIVLSKEVPTSINKDFFLIRRKISSKNSVILDATFPYGVPVTASSSPGILYPEFPTELLNTSASLIVEDLVDKGIIK
jgi:hypothetical protein